MVIQKSIKFKDWDCSIHFNRYVNNNIAITLNDVEDGSSVVTITRWFKDLEQDEVALDINNCGYSIASLLIGANIIEDEIIQIIPSGYCDYPVYKLTKEILQLCQSK